MRRGGALLGYRACGVCKRRRRKHYPWLIVATVSDGCGEAHPVAPNRSGEQYDFNPFASSPVAADNARSVAPP